jgi:NitT/TauT family transport system ATP-binding protein
MPEITLDSVSVEFKRPGKNAEIVTALDRFDLKVKDREFVCLLGPSGCGKSTALNLVAGFAPPTRGRVLIDGIAVTAPGPARGVVFQDANIFPWLTVRENVAFGPMLQGADRKSIGPKVDAYLERVGLAGFGEHLPLELSGGMRQRVGLARVLINDPPVLLMDEPFGALDAQTRIIMQELLLQLWESERKTVIFITHDIDEALLLGDRIVVMTARPGRIKSSLEVPLPRPRNYQITTSSEFMALRRRLFDELSPEAHRADEAEALH